MWTWIVEYGILVYFLIFGNTFSPELLLCLCERSRWLFQQFLEPWKILHSSRIQERLWRHHWRHRGHTSRSLNHIPLPGIFWGTFLMAGLLRRLSIRICWCSRLFRSTWNYLFWLESLGMRSRTPLNLHHHWHIHRVVIWQISNLHPRL